MKGGAASRDDKPGRDPATLRHQDIEGPARGPGVHDFDADALGGQRREQPGMREALRGAGAEQHDVRRIGEQALEILLGERVEARRCPAGNDAVRKQHDVVAVFGRADADPPGTGAGDDVGVRPL